MEVRTVSSYGRYVNPRAGRRPSGEEPDVTIGFTVDDLKQ